MRYLLKVRLIIFVTLTPTPTLSIQCKNSWRNCNYYFLFAFFFSSKLIVVYHIYHKIMCFFLNNLKVIFGKNKLKLRKPLQNILYMCMSICVYIHSKPAKTESRGSKKILILGGFYLSMYLVCYNLHCIIFNGTMKFTVEGLISL